MFKCEFCGEKQDAYMHKLKLWSCEGRQSETCMVSSPRHGLLRRGRKVMVNIKREISAPVVMKLVTCHLSL